MYQIIFDLVYLLRVGLGNSGNREFFFPKKNGYFYTKKVMEINEIFRKWIMEYFPWCVPL